MIYLRDPSFETDEVDEKSGRRLGWVGACPSVLDRTLVRAIADCDNQLVHACGEGRRAAITDLKVVPETTTD